MPFSYRMSDQNLRRSSRPVKPLIKFDPSETISDDEENEPISENNSNEKDLVPEEVEQPNPWDVQHLNEFLFYNCPECQYKTKASEGFLIHAMGQHVLANRLVTNKIIVVTNENPEADQVQDNDDQIEVKEETLEERPVISDPIEVEEQLDSINVIDEMESEPKCEEISVKSSPSKKSKPSSFAGPWQCYVCGEIHESLIDMNKHVKENHFKIVKTSMFGPIRDHQCEICKLMFNSMKALEYHTCGSMPQGKEKTV